MVIAVRFVGLRETSVEPGVSLMPLHWTGRGACSVRGSIMVGNIMSPRETSRSPSRASDEYTQTSNFSTSLVAVGLSTTASCAQMILYWWDTRVGVWIRRHGRRFLLHFSVQHKVVEAIFQSLGTSPSERGRGAVLTISLDSGVATGVAASSSCTSEGGRVRQDGEVSTA